MAKTYRVTQIKLNQFTKMYIISLTCKHGSHLSAITVANISQEFLPTRWRQKSTGIDMEQNYVTVTLSIEAVRGCRL